ncbi:hypothetical protein KAI87_12065 [Myxococcota bacterium]|nr:hypothetical protein [Myxococcota bacterium]
MTYNKTSRARLIPEGAIPCVWMTAGVISYKLCDYDLDCENCPLDAALTGATRKPVIDVKVRNHTSWVFPDDRSYLHKHLWCDSEGRIGLNAFAVELLASVGPLRMICAPGPRREKEPLFHIETSVGNIPIMARDACFVTEINPLATDGSPLLSTDPYGEGWLMKVRWEGEETPSEHDNSEETLEKVRLDMRRFRRQIAMNLLAPMVGGTQTMADGGEPIFDLRTMLGPHGYRTLLIDFLS